MKGKWIALLMATACTATMFVGCKGDDCIFRCTGSNDSCKSYIREKTAFICSCKNKIYVQKIVLYKKQSLENICVFKGFLYLVISHTDLV